MLPLRLLLIEDEPLLRRALTRLLGASCDVMGASSVAEGLALIDGMEPDVILCDLYLDGGRTGLDLYLELAERRPDLASRFVIATGSDDASPKLDRLRQRGVPILRKPLDHEAALAALRGAARAGALAC